MIVAGLGLWFVYLGVLTVRQSEVWRSTESLWLHTIKYFPDEVSFAHASLAKIYGDRKLDYF